MRIKHRLGMVEKTLRLRDDRDGLINYYDIPESERNLLLEVSRCGQMYLTWARDLPERADLDDIVGLLHSRIVSLDPTGWAGSKNLNKIFNDIHQEMFGTGKAQP